VPIMVPQPQDDRKTPHLNDLLLTWGEQQEALILLRYWYECSRGGLDMDLAVVQITKLLLDKHPART